MTNTDLYIQRLLESNPLREPLLRKIIQELGLPVGSHGLDAGCGIGLQTLLLLEAVGSGGHVTGLDILPEMPAHGTAMVAKKGLSNQITFRLGDVNHLPFDDNVFDWIWSADCIGYPAGELPPTLSGLIRVVRSGGRIILLGWSSQSLLPGHPLLEARLNGTCSSYLPFLKDRHPEHHFMRASHWFHDAGLRDIKIQSFVSDIHSLLDGPQRIAIISLFNMLWGTPQPETSQDDWKEYQRLCNPASADFILDIPDYYAFFTYTMIHGRVAKE
jgi:demethylmenaquinone methyltransferase/2-methoxy-6-polyprenyl-1,4-benzoquinol methylase